MDPSARPRMSAADQDARKQRYFLPNSDEDTASRIKQSHLLYPPHVHHYTGDVTDIQDIFFEPGFSPAIVQAHITSTQRKDLTMPSAEPVFVASPTGSDSESSTLASPNKSSTVPSKAILDRAADLTVNDAQGQAVSFKDLYQVEPGHSRRVMIIFIRHFFCGVSPRSLAPATRTNNACHLQNCQEFLRTLVSQIPPTSLPANTSIAIIGCGSHTLIASYVELTSCPYPIYADPTKRLFDVLGMQRSLSLGWNAPNYIHHTLAAGMVKSIVQGVKRIPAGDVTKAGDLSQNGGEYLFEVEGVETASQKEGRVHQPKGNEGLKVKVTFCHRMRNTRDHTEIPQLAGLLGSPESNDRSRRPTSRLERRWTSGGPIGNLARSLSNKSQSWLQRHNSNSWSKTRRRDRSKSSSQGDTGRRSPDRFEMVRENVRSEGGQRLAEDATKMDAVAPLNGHEVKAAGQRFSFVEEMR
jgi:hypothetical protein